MAYSRKSNPPIQGSMRTSAVTGVPERISGRSGQLHEIESEIAYVAAWRLNKPTGLKHARMGKEREPPSSNARSRLRTACQLHFSALGPDNRRINLRGLRNKGINGPSPPCRHKKKQVEARGPQRHGNVIYRIKRMQRALPHHSVHLERHVDRTGYRHGSNNGIPRTVDPPECIVRGLVRSIKREGTRHHPCAFELFKSSLRHDHPARRQDASHAK